MRETVKSRVWMYQPIDGNRPHQLWLRWRFQDPIDLPDRLQRWSAFCTNKFGLGGRIDKASLDAAWVVEVVCSADGDNYVYFDFKTFTDLTMFKLYAE